MYARLRIKGTFAAAAARVGQRRFMKSSTKFIKKLRGYDPETIRWIEKELKKNGDLIFDILTKDQFKQWRRYEERKNH